MTDRKALLELADRVEREPESCEMDYEVFHAMGLSRCRQPQFTSIIDEALGLIPSGAVRWTVRSFTNGYTASIRMPDRSFHHGVADMPARAICAAALRARAG